MTDKTSISGLTETEVYEQRDQTSMLRRDLIGGIAGAIALTSGCSGVGSSGGPNDYSGKFVYLGGSGGTDLTTRSLTGGFSGKDFKFTGKVKNEMEQEVALRIRSVYLFSKAGNQLGWTYDPSSVAISAGATKRIEHTATFYSDKPNESDVSRFEVHYATR